MVLEAGAALAGEESADLPLGGALPHGREVPADRVAGSRHSPAAGGELPSGAGAGGGAVEGVVEDAAPRREPRRPPRRAPRWRRTRRPPRVLLASAHGSYRPR